MLLNDSTSGGTVSPYMGLNADNKIHHIIMVFRVMHGLGEQFTLNKSEDPVCIQSATVSSPSGLSSVKKFQTP